MKILKTLFWAGAAAAAVPLVRKLLAGSGPVPVEHASPYLPVVKSKLEEHKGEDTQMVQAFAQAVDGARPAAT